MNTEHLQFIKESIKTIPDYPVEGILFRDITSLVENGQAFDLTISLLCDHFRNHGFTKVAGTEARGFIFGAPLARELKIGFIPVRKPGKLPRETVEQSYELEYGQDMLQIHRDAIEVGDKVLVIDDLLATGGTIEATISLIRQLGGEVTHAGFVISLPDLGGVQKVTELNVNVTTLVEFEGT